MNDAQPFHALLPFDQRILLFDYIPMTPVCYESLVEESLSSDSDSDTTTD